MAMKFEVVLFFAFALFLAKINGLSIDKLEPAGDKAALTVPDPPISSEHEQKFVQDGYCHWDHRVWIKPNSSVLCGCLNCTCEQGGKWDCAYSFKDCPYYYCGNVHFNPQHQLCCCGKVYEKKRNFACCGDNYYSTRVAQCCNFYTVLPRSSKCPRSSIGHNEETK